MTERILVIVNLRSKAVSAVLEEEFSGEVLLSCGAKLSARNAEPSPFGYAVIK